MAADGRSNREIAQALYVSHKTVEKHLTAAYRKLGVDGRDDLATALAEE
jgi:DNA-binding CsgD family transcriptional regulator